MVIKIHQNYLEICEEIKDKLETFIKLVNEKDVNYIKDISGYLRNIYCYKSGKKSFLSRIFFDHNIDIVVSVLLSFKEDKKLGYLPENFPEPIYSQLNSASLWFSGNKNIKQLSILDAIKNEQELYIGGSYYNYKDFIEIVADKFDAHLDETIKIEENNIFGGGMYIGGMNTAYRGLYDLAIATIKVMEEIISFLNTGKETEFLKINKLSGKQ